MKNLNRVIWVTLGLSLGGCSPGMFFGDQTDESIYKIPNYRKVNSACSEMKISSSNLDVATFRGLVKCLNANGALDPINKLINGSETSYLGSSSGLTDDELRPLVSMVNRHLINNRDRLHQIDASYRSMEKSGLVDDSFQQLSKIMGNRNFVSSSISLLKNGYFSAERNNILRSAELLSTKITEKNLSQAIDTGLNLADSRPFKSLVPRFKDLATSRNGTPHLKSIVENFFHYLRTEHTYVDEGKPRKIREEWFQAVRDGTLNDLLEDLAGKNEGEIRNQVPKLAATLQLLTQPNATDSEQAYIENISSVFRDLNQPLSCMKNSQSIPNGAMLVVRELCGLKPSLSPTQYILRDLPLTLSAVQPFCDLPLSIARHYPALAQLARQGAAEPLRDLLKKFHARRFGHGHGHSHGPGNDDNSNAALLMINLMGDQQDGFKKLVPAMKEITDRDAWQDLLLLSAIPEKEDQNRIRETLSFFLDARPELDGKSIWDVMLASITPADYLPLYNLASSLEEFINSDEQYIVPLLNMSRSSFYTNNVHPFVGLVRDIASEATHSEDLFKTFFLIADKKEFLNSLTLLSTMAKDGRLKELTSVSLSLFSRFANSGPDLTQILNTTAPKYIAKRRHSLNAADLKPYVFDKTLADTISNECDQLDLTFSIADTNNPKFDETIQRLIRCQNGAGIDNDISQALSFLRTHRTESGVPFLSYQINLAKELFQNPDGSGQGLTTSEVRYLFKSWMSAYDDGRFFRLVDALGLWIRGTPETTGPVLQPALDVAGAVVSRARSDLDSLSQFISKVLKKSDFPKLLADLDGYFNKTFSAQTEDDSRLREDRLGKIFTPKLRARIEKWVDYKECVPLSQDPAERLVQVQKRTDEIFAEAKENRTNWDLVGVDPARRNQSGKPRQSWELEGQNGLKTWLNPLLTKLADKTQSVPDKWILDSFLNFLKYFQLAADGSNSGTGSPRPHYRPERLVQWLYERSIDYRPITYYYPGETIPRVRIINTLDALELLLVNVDFHAPPPLDKNLGLEFLAELGDAWGDFANPQDWPAEIRKKYPNPAHRPMTLAEASEDITNRKHPEDGFDLDNIEALIEIYVGLPKLPACHRNVPGEAVDRQAPVGGAQYYMTPEQIADFQVRMYNIWQVLSVMKENTPGSGVGFNGGLELLRDLLYEVNYSTPSQFQLPDVQEKNNLSAVMRTVRLGVLRQIGRLMMQVDPKDPAVLDFFTTLVRSVESPQTRELAAKLILNPGQKLIWNTIEQLFYVADHAKPAEIDAAKQAGFYSLAYMNRMEPWEPKTGKGEDLLNVSMLKLNGVLDRFTPFLETQKDMITDGLGSEKVASFLRAAYEEKDTQEIARVRGVLLEFLTEDRLQNGISLLRVIYGDSNSTTRKSWKAFLSRADLLTHSPTYETLHIKEAMRPILNFLEKKSSSGGNVPPMQAQLAEKLTLYVAGLAANGDLDQILILAHDHPAEFDQLLETLSQFTHSQGETGFKDFLGLIKRSLPARD